MQLMKMLGLLTMAISFVFLTAASHRIVLTTDHEVGGNWRTSYDILVRPPGTVQAIEAANGLVRANFLSGIYGGISMEQYEAIKNLPEVEIAAPIAMVGYLTTKPVFPFEIQDGTLYKVDRRIESSDSVLRYSKEDEVYFLKSALSPNPGTFSIEEHMEFVEQLIKEGLYIGVDAGSISPGEQNFFLLAGIDPTQEARLLDFSDSITNGRFLSNDDLVIEETGTAVTLRTGETFDTFYWFPLLINSHIYEQQKAFFQVSVIDMPDSYTLQQNAYVGGREYLDSLPVSQNLFSQELDLSFAYDWVFATLQRNESPLPVDHSVAQVRISPFGSKNFQQPAPVTYRDYSSQTSVEHDIVLEAVPLGNADDGQVLFRGLGTLEFKHPHNFRLVGTLDMARIRDPYSTRLNQVPLETYYPPVAAWLYDDNGESVESSLLIPTMNAQSYISRPPYALTTLEAACIIAGDNCISAIRIRVRGIEELDERSQSKIEEVARKIFQVTGLYVDIMVGSSPRSVLIHLPDYEGSTGIGYVEESWVQKGVSISIFRGFHRADLIFFAVSLFVLVIFVAESSQLAVLSRRSEIGLLAALGWRHRNIAQLFLQESIILAFTAGTFALTLSLAIGELIGLESRKWALYSLPICVAAYLVASLPPVLSASRGPPTSTMRRGELHFGHNAGPSRSIWDYAIRSLNHRRLRTILALVCIGVSNGLVSFLLGASQAMDGYLYGTLLGEHVSLSIEGYHIAMVALCFVASALVVFDTMLMNAIERRQEISILKSVGWRAKDVMGNYVLEAAILGFVGGTLGWVVGTVAAWLLRGAIVIGPIWLSLLALGLPIFVSMIAGLYPSLVAAKSPPAGIDR